MEIKCYAFENDETELESPFLEYLQRYAPADNESEKERDKRVKKVENVKEHIKYLLSIQGIYNKPPLVKHYKLSRTVGDISEIGILKIKEGRILIRIGFVTFKKEKEIVLFDAFDKPDNYEKKKKREIKRTETEFTEKIADYIAYHLEHRDHYFDLPL